MSKSQSPVSVSDLSVPDDVRQELAQTSSNIIDLARSLKITNESELAAAANVLTTIIRPALKQIDETFKPNVDRWHQGHKAALADMKKIAAPFNLAKDIIDNWIGDYDKEKKRIKAEEQRKIAQYVRDEAERQAIERAVQLIESDDEQENLQATEILYDLAKGEITPASSTLPPAILRPVKAEGVAIKHYWRFNIINPHLVKPAYCSPDERLIQNVVTEKGMEAEEIVGKGSIEIYEKTNVASRSIT